ncbi:hypothetical protein BaRGS_00029501 [Batillaria attramentaria]|uniref:Uncharacterized protein n=1 Tax=Batillaria attramentaria TaxID=370345 RepID=A0ABD0JWE7_9CAEN
MEDLEGFEVREVKAADRIAWWQAKDRGRPVPPGALAPLEHVHIGAMEQDKALAASRREDSGQEPTDPHPHDTSV